jgi:hypothetical protein
MHLSRHLTAPFFGICLALSSLTPCAARAHDAGTQMSAIARVFLAALSPEQKAKACFEFAGEERETGISFPASAKGCR